MQTTHIYIRGFKKFDILSVFMRRPRVKPILRIYAAFADPDSPKFPTFRSRWLLLIIYLNTHNFNLRHNFFLNHFHPPKFTRVEISSNYNLCDILSKKVRYFGKSSARDCPEIGKRLLVHSLWETTLRAILGRVTHSRCLLISLLRHKRVEASEHVGFVDVLQAHQVVCHLIHERQR